MSTPAASETPKCRLATDVVQVPACVGQGPQSTNLGDTSNPAVPKAGHGQVSKMSFYQPLWAHSKAEQAHGQEPAAKRCASRASRSREQGSRQDRSRIVHGTYSV